METLALSPISSKDEFVLSTTGILLTLLAIVNLDANDLIHIASKLWQPNQESSFRHLSGKIILFSTNDRMILEKIYNSGPWFYYRTLILFEEYVPFKPRCQYSFQMSYFWVNILNVPRRLHSLQHSINIGNKFGEFLEFDYFSCKNNSFTALRIRVNLDIAKPLRTHIIPNMSNSTSSPLPLKYEYLPLYCYNCGYIGHNEAQCTAPILLLPQGSYHFSDSKKISQSIETTFISANRKQCD